MFIIKYVMYWEQLDRMTYTVSFRTYGTRSMFRCGLSRTTYWPHPTTVEWSSRWIIQCLSTRSKSTARSHSKSTSSRSLGRWTARGFWPPRRTLSRAVPAIVWSVTWCRSRTGEKISHCFHTDVYCLNLFLLS